MGPRTTIFSENFFSAEIRVSQHGSGIGYSSGTVSSLDELDNSVDVSRRVLIDQMSKCAGDGLTLMCGADYDVFMSPGQPCWEPLVYRYGGPGRGIVVSS